jgi:hypothetical protein
MKYFSENWDGIKRKTVDEAKDPTAKQIKALRLSSEKGKTKQGKNANIMTAKDDPAQVTKEEQQPLSEEALGMKYFTDMDDLAKDIVEYAKTLKGKKNIGGFTPEQAALHQIAGALRQGHEQMLHFFDGLIYHLESIHKKTMSPSKHGNMEIMNSLSMVIRELKKYKK